MLNIYLVYLEYVKIEIINYFLEKKIKMKILIQILNILDLSLEK